jgi:hypothetical protein
MFDVETSKGKMKVPVALVERAAERIWRQPKAARDHRLETARKRLNGAHPTMRDAAIVALDR